MGPDVKRLIGQLEEAEDAVGGGAAGMAVAGDDAVLMEHLRRDGNTAAHSGLLLSHHTETLGNALGNGSFHLHGG